MLKNQLVYILKNILTTTYFCLHIPKLNWQLFASDFAVFLFLVFQNIS